MYPYYGMFVRPNYTYVGYHFSKYPKSSLFTLFKATQLKAGYGWKNSVSFHQLFKEYKGINIEYSEELSSRILGINAREIQRDSCLTFHKWLQAPSEIFPNHAIADASREYFLKVGYKRRRNDVDINKASPEFMKHSLNQDKLFSTTIGYLANEFKDISFSKGSTTEVSGEYATDNVNTTFLHLKAHHRRFMAFENYRVQAHIKWDKVINMNDAHDLSINDRILLRNFKGVKDVGQKYYKQGGGKVEKDKSRLPVGDSLGFKNVLEIGAKLTSTDLPYFKMYQIENIFWTVRPFLFANLAILPDGFLDNQDIVSNIKSNSVASAGFGLQLIHYWLCAELYYSVAVHKHNYEFGTELQFNFGLD